MCYEKFDASSKALSPAVMTICGHSTCCRGCFTAYIKNKVKSKDVTPWIGCPEVRVLPVCCSLSLLSTDALFLFALALLFLLCTGQVSVGDCGGGSHRQRRFHSRGRPILPGNRLTVGHRRGMSLRLQRPESCLLCFALLLPRVRLHHLTLNPNPTVV